jgi:hypothetical protein
MLERKSLRQLWSRLIALTITAITLIVLGWRMLHGFGFSDEAFYVALPLRFAMGDRPFVDELNIAQTAGLLMYPFIKAYNALLGTAGIFLYIRVLFLAFFACVGWSAYAFIRPHLPRPAALLIAVACMCFIPYGAPGLSYNTLSMGLFSIGVFSIGRWLLAPHAERRFWKAPVYWAGLAHAAACLAYPSFLLTILVTAAGATALARGRRLHALLLYAAGGSTFVLLFSPVLYGAGLANVRAMIAYTGGGSLAAAFSLPALAERFAVFHQQHPELLVSLPLAAAGVVAARWLPLAAALALAAALPLLALGTELSGYLGSLGYVASFALLGPILCFGVPNRRFAAVLGLGVIAPSLLHGVVMSASSGNGVIAAGIGMFPAAIAAAVALAAFVEHHLSPRPLVRQAMVLAPALFVCALLHQAAGENSYYVDGPTSELTARVDHGPFWGLYTTPKQHAFLEELSADLYAHRGAEGSRIYCNVPAGYIIAERRPLMASAWIFPSPSKSAIDARFFLERARPGALVLIVGEEYNQLLQQIVPSTTERIATRTTHTVQLYRGFGRGSGASVATSAPHPVSIKPTPPVPPPLDQWLPLAPAAGNPTWTEGAFAFGWSWPEDWGRWSSAYVSGLVVPLPAELEGVTADVVVQLDLVPHRKRGHPRQRYRILAAGEQVVAGELRSDGVVELTVPARLQEKNRLYLHLELPDAFLSSDFRILGIGLKRVKISRPTNR